MIKKLFLLSAFVGIFFVTNMVAAADIIHQFDVEVDIGTDGKIEVSEKILYDFGDIEGHGIFREIPVNYGDEGLVVPIEVTSVTDENGESYTYEETWGGTNKNIKIGDPDVFVSGQKWYYISYEVEMLINGFEDHDEFYWNVAGNGWDVVIEKASARVKVPSGGLKAPKFATCYTGGFESTEQNCTYEIVDNDVFEFQSAGELFPYEGLTIVAGFEKGLVPLPAFLAVTVDPFGAEIYLDGEFKSYAMPTLLRILPGAHVLDLKSMKYHSYTQEIDVKEGERIDIDVTLEKKDLWIFLDYYFPFVLLIFGAWAIFSYWRKNGKDPEGRGTIMPFYKPTDGLTPGEMGVIVDELADLRDITATIINLAVNGYLRIEKKEGKDEDYHFVKLKDAKSGLPNFEKTIFEAIFKGAATDVTLAEMKKSFYKDLPKIKEALYQAVTDGGHFAKRPDEVRKSYLWKAIGIDFLITTLIFGALAFFSMAYFVLLILPGLLIIFAFFMPKKTPSGKEVYERILGFKMFMDTAEKDRIKVLFSPKEYAGVFEKNLPYAMVLKVEKSWVKQFAGLYDGVPDWYVVGGVTNINYFLNDIENFETSATTSFMGPQSSSSGGWSGGSGFGGGGFSGGGFGGGGGGRW